MGQQPHEMAPDGPDIVLGRRRGGHLGLVPVDPPAVDWIDDDAEVSRRVSVKVAEGQSPQIWWRAVDVVRICRRLAHLPGLIGNAPAFPMPAQLPASGRLPRPRPRPVPDEAALPGRAGGYDAAAGAPRLELRRQLDRAARRLAAALEGAGAVDPAELAGWIDEAVLALRAYGLDLLAAPS